MRLKTRLTLLFLLVAWAPLSVAGWLMTERMEERFASEFRVRSDAVQAAVGERFKQLAAQLTVALTRMSGDTILETELLQPLSHRQFYGDAQRQRAIVREARRLITSPAVDTLRLVDLARKGHVIALGHRQGEEPPDTEVVDVAATALRDGVDSTLLMRKERVENPDSGEAEELWTLQVVRVVPPGRKGRVAMVGGRILSKELLGALVRAAAGEAHVALDVRGTRVAATFEGDRPPPVDGGYSEQPSEVIGRQGKATTSGEAADPLATLTVWIKRDVLMQTRRQLWRNAAYLGAATGLLALLLGLWFSARLSRPLEELAEAASQVASGRRDPVVRETRGKDEIAQLTRAFNQMTLDLAAGEERLRQSERVAAWREIARRIAHEIKNPLFPIQMSIETLQKVWRRQHPDFEEIFDESTETILEEVERMKRIVTEFSDFARMPAPKPERLDLGELCGTVVGFHRDSYDDLEITLQAGEPVWVSVDPDQWRQVMTNLVQNAIEAMADSELRRLLVVVGTVDGRARIEVADSGPGMNEETQGRLFTPYFTTKATGTGLGLAIVHRIVEEHRGSVRVESEEGAGARFIIELPLA